MSSHRRPSGDADDAESGLPDNFVVWGAVASVVCVRADNSRRLILFYIACGVVEASVTD
jgi:hypothetical protein